MRTSSERSPRGIPADTPPNENDGVRADTGYGYGSSSSRVSSSRGSSYKKNKQYREYKEWKPDSAQDQPPFTERRAREFAFAEKVLGDQHPGFCVVAMIAIQMRGETPTRENVLERLTASGREASQIGYGPGGYAA
jgi:hypothetical protein